MIEKFDTFSITHLGRIGLLLSCTKKIIHHFTDWPDVKVQINSMINDSWLLMEIRTPDCSAIYHLHNPLLIEYELKFHSNESLLKAFHAILYMHYYVIEKMYVIEYFETKKEPIVGSDVFEVSEDYFFDCLNNCIEVSGKHDQLQNWISEKIFKLKKEYSSQNDGVLSNKKIPKSFFN